MPRRAFDADRRAVPMVGTFGAFGRWLFAGPWYSVSPQIAVFGIGIWLVAGTPSRRSDATVLHGVGQLIGSAVGAVLLIGLIAYWQLQVRRDEPPRIRSRWDRRRH